MNRIRIFLCIGLMLPLVPCAAFSGGKEGVIVDKAKKIIKIDAKVAPRKLPHLKGEVYPIEVIACWPHPKGKKAHETVVTIDATPSAVHRALVGLGFKPGKPVMGGEDEPQGPAVHLYLEIKASDGILRRVPIDKTLIDMRNKKSFPKSVRWRFTGSALSKSDPSKDETVYGADLSGTLIAIFPVTDQTVFQTNLTFKDEKYLKLETNTKVLPPEGTPVTLVIDASR